MHILKSSILGFFCLIQITLNYCFAQTTPLEIQYVNSEELIINTKPIDSKTGVESLIERFGEPSNIQEYRSGEKSYFYSETGIVFFTKNGFVIGLGINFNWDGDKKFPEKSYTGKLKIGESDIHIETKIEFIQAIKSIDFICPIPIMCASKNRTAKVNCTLAFENEKLTQVAFILN